MLRQNGGVTTLRELERLGFSYKEVCGFVAHGDLRRLQRGVYADGRAPLQDRTFFRAALLAVGSGAWLPGRTAAMAQGLEAPSLARIEVAVVASSTPKRQGLRITRVSTPPDPSEIRTVKGLRVSSVPRLLIEVAAAGGTKDDLNRLIDAAVGRNRLDVHDLAATINRHTGERGTVALKQICEEYLPRQDRKSGLERSFDRYLAKHPEIPDPQRNIHLGPFEIDCYWPEHQLALELDGRPYHTIIEDIDRDRRKDTWLQAHSIQILRVTDSRWKRDKQGVHCDLNTLLTIGARRAAA